MNSMEEYASVVQKALDTLGDQPGDFAMAIEYTAGIREVDFPKQAMGWLYAHLAEAGPDDAIAHKLGLSLRAWDRLKNGKWCGDTEPYTDERRLLIYKRLKLSQEVANLLGKKLPKFSKSDLPIVVAEKHTPWYFGKRLEGRFYWDSYANYLAKVKHWNTTAITKLDDATDSVLTEITDPTQVNPYKSKGLVIGYVQSGKTSHFIGVLAKAADTGYRLIIVLAGTLDILRLQTQRRIDKELIGKEVLGSDSEYNADPDWPKFISYDFLPSDNGHFDWERLTGLKDFEGLGEGRSALSFEPADKSKSFYDEANLRKARVRVLVVKKNAKILTRLATDLEKENIRTHLSNVPALIVDDESDQASINTIDPKKKKEKPTKEEQKEASERTAINRAILDLMKRLPRAQYVGYTATPFANVLVNADDVDDLFPRDFIIALPRPDDYFGVSNFYDLQGEKVGFTSNKRAFIRDVRGDDSGGENLLKAIDSFVLAGAIKLFRKNANPDEANDGRYEHHTMLVHHSSYRKVHLKQAKQIEEIWNHARHRTQGKARLEKLYQDDFLPVSGAQEPGLPMPKSFANLSPFVEECLQKLETNKTIRIVNGDNKDDTPNFEKGSVWSILVGGAKLSRGYTVEGLTTSYFRRVAKTTDTLMQMGRWFGFRPGYRDLVRLFIGRDEPIGNAPPKPAKKKTKRKTLDLYEAFRAMCQDEEEFRAEVQKNLSAGIRPIQLPPLVPAHLRALAPTARNKRYNARLTFRNVGSSRVERTLAPTDKKEAQHNTAEAILLLKDAKLHEERFEFRENANSKVDEVRAYVGEVSPDRMLKFLQAYKWESGKDILEDEKAYLAAKHGDPCIDRWLVIVPRLKGTGELWPKKADGPPQTEVRHRGRIGRRYGSMSDPSDVLVANYLAGIGDSEVVPVSINLQKYAQPKTAVMLMYAVTDEAKEEFVSVLFALQLPKNNISRRLGWTTIITPKHGEATPVVVPLVKKRA